MIKWYKDEELAILFDIEPNCNIRLIEPNFTKEEKKDIEKYPFINNKDLNVLIIDYVKDREYNFKINKDYKWDGASIPRLFWRVTGAKTDPRFLIPSLIHDVLCENHKYVDNDRYLATRIFERLLYVSGVCDFKRWMMFHSVDNFQKICAGWNK